MNVTTVTRDHVARSDPQRAAPGASSTPEPVRADRPHPLAAAGV
jgi:hypothetical protein